MNLDLDRFILAQVDYYNNALTELRAGYKKSEWMWFIFPQLKSLGRTSTARYYGLAGKLEAQAYLEHPILGERLRRCTISIQSHAPMKSAQDILGRLDAVKLCSCMTLFSLVSNERMWTRTIELFFNGKSDPITLNIIDN
jgi:uncharacterized protein (DUF1810 family)